MNVLVYSGAGVSSTSLSHTLYSLRKVLSSSYAIETISAPALASHPWASSCVLLVIPGGRDVPYVSSLAGAATRAITKYVQSGGSFLGLCAGAYFGSKRVEWEVGTPMQVVGDRPLGFYPGVCEGCVYKGFEYETENGARSIALDVLDPQGHVTVQGLYYNGGGHFVGADGFLKEGVTPLTRYVDGEGAGKVATVKCDVGQGVAVLSSVHVEYPLVFEPASSALRKSHPALTDGEKLDMENKRWEIWEQMLRVLRLHVGDAPHPSAVQPSTPLPQIMTFSPSVSGDRDQFFRAITGSLSPSSSSGVPYRVLQDTDDTFLIYPSASGLSDILEQSRTKSLASPELPASFPKSVVLCTSADDLPSSSDTPLFNIREYYANLAERQERHARKTKFDNSTSPSSNWRMGESLLYGEVVTSTQTLLDKNPTFLRALPHPLLSLASHQLSGRGRGSNAWITPHGCLTFSLVLRSPRLPNPSLVFIQYLAGLAVTEACRELMGEEVGGRVRLKWPNDVYVVTGGKGDAEKREKIGGILVTTNFSGGMVDIIVGVGLNVLNARPTTSLAHLLSASVAATSKPLTMEDTLAAIMVTFEAMWNRFVANRGSFEPFVDVYLERWLHSDQLVTLTTTTPPTRVRLVGITLDHGLLRTVPEKTRSGFGVGNEGGFIDLQPDGNSFDMLAGLIKTKSRGN